MKINKILPIIAMAGIFSLAACEKDGPLENAGEQVDDAVDSLQDGAENMGDTISEAAEDACDAVGDATNSDADC